MRVGIEINNVLRNTLLRIEQVYEKWYVDNPFKEVEDNNEENNDNGLINIDNLHLDDTAIVDSNV